MMYQKRSLATSPRSAANTPIWQVTLDRTRTVVLIDANGLSRCAPGQAPPAPLVTERTVKYIANRAAKNMSSEDSQMMVPTLTRLGRCGDGARGAVSAVVTVATWAIMATWRRHVSRAPRNSARSGAGSGDPAASILA